MFVCLIALVTGGCESSDAAPAPGAKEASAAKKKKRGPRAATIATASVTIGSLNDEWSYLGTARLTRNATLAAEVAGRLVSLEGREGDRLSAGQTVARVDDGLLPPRLQAARASAASVEARLAQAKRELARANKLVGTAMTAVDQERAKASVSELRAEYRSRRASIDAVKAERARYVVSAPWSGVVAARHTEPGGWVSPGTPLVTLVDPSSLEVLVDVAPSLSDKLVVGHQGRLHNRAGSTPATIVGVVPALDPTTRTLKVRLTPDGPAPWLLPGATVEATFAVTLAVDSKLVPRDAIVRGPASARVMKVVEGKAQPVPVKVVAAAGDKVVVTADGLAAGDKVVVRGNDRLRPGQAVTEGGPPGKGKGKPGPPSPAAGKSGGDAEGAPPATKAPPAGENATSPKQAK